MLQSASAATFQEKAISTLLLKLFQHGPERFGNGFADGGPHQGEERFDKLAAPFAQKRLDDFIHHGFENHAHARIIGAQLDGLGKGVADSLRVVMRIA